MNDKGTKKYASQGGFPCVNKLLKDFLDLDGELLVCMPCLEKRNICKSELPEGAKITAAGQLNIAAIKADAVFVY